jgi:hypothetical protein
MNKKTGWMAMGLVALTLAYPQKVSAEDVFKSSSFLTWDYESQAFYIRTSVGMTSLIVGRNNEAHGKCVDSWYYSDEEKGNEYIFSVMQEHPEFHPRGVILAALEKKCGRFIYR